MGDLFKGWRRKIGCVTLVMALVCMGGWIRSNEQCDVVIWTFNQSRYGVSSLGNSIFLSRETPPPDPDFARPFDWGPVKLSMVGGFSPQERNKDGSFKPFDPMKTYVRNIISDVRWRWDWIGFHVGVADNRDGPTTSQLETCLIPYWSITVPLTLLSTFLLLTKPRKSSPKKIIEAATNEGGATS